MDLVGERVGLAGERVGLVGERADLYCTEEVEGTCPEREGPCCTGAEKDPDTLVKDLGI